MSDLLKSLFSQVAVSLPAFLVAIAGTGLALVWLQVSPLLAVVVALLLVGIGATAYKIGDSLLAESRPRAVAGERWLRWTLLFWIGVAAAAGAAILVLAIEFAEDKAWSEERKQLTAACVAAVETYLTTVFIKGADEADEGWVGKLVKSRFEKRFKNRFPNNETAVRNAAFDLTRGWDGAERRTRAKEIQQYIDNGGEVLAAP